MTHREKMRYQSWPLPPPPPPFPTQINDASSGCGGKGKGGGAFGPRRPGYGIISLHLPYRIGGEGSGSPRLRSVVTFVNRR